MGIIKGKKHTVTKGCEGTVQTRSLSETFTASQQWGSQ